MCFSARRDCVSPSVTGIILPGVTDSEWLTWNEAAELVGCPVATIDWHKRQGRIVSRGRRARSLQRTSVEEFGTWWTKREKDRVMRRAARRPPAIAGPPERQDRLSTAEAATVLDLSTTHVCYLVRRGDLPATKRGARVWICEDDVDALLEERQRWISSSAAAAIIGVSSSTVTAHARAGLIEQRPGAGRTASLSRASVERYAEQRRAELEQRARDRAIKHTQTGPPDDGQVWFDTTTTALVLGVSTTRLRQLALRGRLPFTEHGARRWFARHHVEQRAAARALARACG